MTPEEGKRKLTAILSVDVKGYSRIMGEDGEWTLRILNTCNEDMAGFIQKYRAGSSALFWENRLRKLKEILGGDNA